MSKVTYIFSDQTFGVTAEFVVTPAAFDDAQQSVGADLTRFVTNSLRQLDPTGFSVKARYPRISNEVHIFNKRNITMDLSAHIVTPETASETRKQYFIAPAPRELPDDGILNYFTVVDIFDIRSAPERTVLLFGVDAYDILAVLTSNQKVFNAKFTLLAGLPDAEYTSEFEKNVWNLDRSSYSVLVSDLKAAVETASLLEAASQTTHDRERAHYVRKDGTVKAFDDFVIGGDIADEDA